MSYTTEDDGLSALAGEGWQTAEVETIDERLPLTEFSVEDVSFVAGPRDDRPGRDDHGDGTHIGTSSEGSSTVQRFAVDGDLLVEVEGDYQPGAVSPRLRVTEREDDGGSD